MILVGDIISEPSDSYIGFPDTSENPFDVAQKGGRLSNGSSASFVGYGSGSFQVKNRGDGRDALALRGSLAATTENGIQLGVFAGTELFKAGYSDVQGGLSIGWNF